MVRIKSRRFKRARLTFPRRKMDWDMNFEKRNHGHCLPWKFYLWPTDPHRTCARPHSIPADLSISLKFKSGYQMGQLAIFEDAYLSQISRKFRNLVPFLYTKKDRAQRKFSQFSRSWSRRGILFRDGFNNGSRVVTLSSISNSFDDDEGIEESRVESGQWRDVHAPIAW